MQVNKGLFNEQFEGGCSRPPSECDELDREPCDTAPGSPHTFPHSVLRVGSQKIHTGKHRL